MINTAIQNFGTLFEKLKEQYRVDLSNYAPGSLERRVARFLSLYHFCAVEDLQDRLLREETFFDLFIREITVNTTEMFRDPETWRLIRNDILPGLKENPTIRIWHAGCSSGEEVFSMAILLQEEGLLEKSKIIASDLNKSVIEVGMKGAYSSKSLLVNEENYIKSGGRVAFQKYYQIKASSVQMDTGLLRNVRFLKHDLSIGSSFSKFDIILCRNVLIYFNKDLQERAFSVFQNSLFKKGFIVIGKKETMNYYSRMHCFNEFSVNEKVYCLK